MLQRAICKRGPRLAPPTQPAPRRAAGCVTTAAQLIALAARRKFVETEMFETNLSDASPVFMYSTRFAPSMPAPDAVALFAPDPQQWWLKARLEQQNGTRRGREQRP